ncbi:Rieske (2Fe-2S) protein [Bradyrhizobium canariense]|uniref:Rieske (2Fe-2S) protein n=1 Tax=Bradyrhizobium canariense TaxID=255045 RepID=UPI001C67EBA6|nr:Rieske (2Fe-2S) protein [Bradyrhizobium canariense]MBW5440501.1 Rieske (2Fe-2S) protein [Bradyrhizobium canariense]
MAPMPDLPRRRLCHVSEVNEGQARGFGRPGAAQDDLFLLRRNGQVHAYLNACPHLAGAPLPWRKDAYLSPEGSAIVCGAHGARFDPTTGLCFQGPCLGEQLRRADIMIDEKGNVFY